MRDAEVKNDVDALKIALNGAPTGIMPGTPAVVQGTWGNGRTLLLSPHLESMKTDPETREKLLELLPRLAGISASKLGTGAGK